MRKFIRERFYDQISSIIWWLIVATVVTAGAVAWEVIQAGWGPLLIPLGFGTLGTVFWAINGVRRLRHEFGHRSDSALQRVVRDWLDEMMFDVRAAPTDDVVFRYVITDRAGRPVDVHKDPKHPDLLFFAGGLGISPERTEEFTQLTEQEMAALIYDLRIALVEFGVESNGIRRPLDEINIGLSVLADASLTKTVVGNSVLKIISGLELIRQMLNRALLPYSTIAPQSDQQTSGVEHQ